MGNLPGGQKLRIKIARGKFKYATAVFFEYGFIISFTPFGPQHAGNTVIVCGYGHRPVAKFFKILFQQPRGRAGGNDWIPALIDGITHRHIVFAGRAGKLPHTGRTEFTVCFGIKR